MSKRILLVDDDVNVLAGYQRTLRKHFVVDTAASGAQGLAKLSSDGPYAVVVADMNMPHMNGIEFLKQAAAEAPDTVRIMLTGNADQKTAADAVNQGHIFRFINKPCPSEMVTLALEAGLKQHYLLIAERELLERTLNGAVKVLTDVLAAVDPHSFGRSRQVQEYMRMVSHSFKGAQSWELEIAALLAPIGRVTLPPAVLQKERGRFSLGGLEKDMLVRVPEVGAELLEQIPRLENVASIVRFQNQNFDAAENGGDAIPIGARILKVLIDLVELEARGLSKAAALAQMQQASGCFDPQVILGVGRCFNVALPGADEKLVSSISISVQDLRVGQILAADVLTTDSLLVVAAGATLTSMLVERLRNFRALGTIVNTVSVRGKVS